MKLAIVIPGFQSSPADWCIPAFTNLAREMARTNDVHVFALRYPPRKDRYTIGSVRVHAVGGGAFGGSRIPLVSLGKLWAETAYALAKEHRAARFDAVIGVWATESGWLASHAARLLGIPSLIHLAGGELVWLPDINYGNQGSTSERLLVGMTLRRATLLTYPSEPVKRLVNRPAGLDKKLAYWPLGVDTDFFTPTTRTSSGFPFVFATAGSLIPIKDHELLLKGFAALREQARHLEVRLEIAGSGPLLDRLTARVGSLNLEGYVHFVGEVPHDDLPAFFNRADCFVLTSRYEAQCMAVLEAMSCGVPWVGPPVGALANLMGTEQRKQRSGIGISSRTPRALAAAMQQMAEQPSQVRAGMGFAARQAVVSDYDLGTQARRLEPILARLTAQGGLARITQTST